MKLSKQDERELEEAIYLLFVKVSTLPVWLFKFKPTLEATGTTRISILSMEMLEKKSKQLARITFQVDVYCSEEEGISMEEIEYIDHMLKSARKEKLIVNSYKFVEYEINSIVDNRGVYKMAADGFERVMMWGVIGMSKPIP